MAASGRRSLSLRHALGADAGRDAFWRGQDCIAALTLHRLQRLGLELLGKLRLSLEEIGRPLPRAVIRQLSECTPAVAGEPATVGVQELPGFCWGCEHRGHWRAFLSLPRAIFVTALFAATGQPTFGVLHPLPLVLT